MLDDRQFDPRALRDAFGCFPSGITVVTTRDHGGLPTGVTVSSFSSLSLEPPLCVFSLIRTQVSCRWIEAREAFTVNILGAEQTETAVQFATPSENKFDGIGWTEGRNGMPVIAGSLAHFECAKWAIYDGGDHLLIVGEITHFARSEGTPLIYRSGKIVAVTG